MTRMPPFDRPAAREDLLQVPDNLVAEILDGELHGNERPAPGIGGATTVLAGMLVRGLRSGPAEWQLLPEPELRLAGDVLVPALAAWRLPRLPELPATPYFPVPPDWVCEVSWSGTASFRARKMAAYARHGVSHAWLIDPVARTLEVRRLEAGRWTGVSTHIGEQVVRAQPFGELDLSLGGLWPGEVIRDLPKRR